MIQESCFGSSVILFQLKIWNNPSMFLITRSHIFKQSWTRNFLSILVNRYPRHSKKGSKKWRRIFKKGYKKKAAYQEVAERYHFASWESFGRQHRDKWENQKRR